MGNSYEGTYIFIEFFEDLVEPMGFESTSDMETKEFCGAAWPSKVLKGKRGNAYCPPRKFLGLETGG